MAVVGWILIVLGVLSTLAGLIFGVVETFRDFSRGPRAQSALPTAFFDVLKLLIEAPRDKMFFVGGIMMTALGLILVGAQIF